jgi:hypothetical protein
MLREKQNFTEDLTRPQQNKINVDKMLPFERVGACAEKLNLLLAITS